MRILYGTVTATGRINNTADNVKAIEFHARSDNPASCVVGGSDVSATNGREIPPDGTQSPNLDEGSVPFSVFYAFVPNDCLLDYTAIVNP